MRLWDRAERIIIGLLGLMALVLALWESLSRHLVPEASIGYAEEVIVYLVIWAAMIASSQLVRTNGHVRSDLIFSIVPAWMSRWMEILNCMAAMAFCAALVWYGSEIVATSRLIDERSSSVLRFPMWLYYATLPAGGGLMLIRYAIRLAGVITMPGGQSLRRHGPGKHELASLEPDA